MFFAPLNLATKYNYLDEKFQAAYKWLAETDLGNTPEKFGGDDCIVFVKNAFPFLDKKYRTIDHPRYHELREVGEFNLDDWNWDRKCERDRVHRAEVEEMRWRIEEARSFFDPEFFM